MKLLLFFVLLAASPGSWTKDCLAEESVSNTQRFLEEVPGLLSLLSEIAEVHPELAMSIWSDLSKLTIELEHDPIDGLAENVSAIRRICSHYQKPDRLVIYRTAFECSDKLRELLKVSLRKIFSGQWVSPNQAVDELLKILIGEPNGVRTPITRDSIELILGKKAIHLEFETQDALLRSVYTVLFNEEGSFEARCSLLGFQSMKSGSLSGTAGLWNLKNALTGAFSFFPIWANYSKCTVLEPYLIFKAELPILYAYITTPRAMVIFGQPYRLTLTSRDGKTFNRGMCELYAGKVAWDRLRKAQKLIFDAHIELLKFKNASTKHSDPAIALYLEMLIRLDPGPDQLDVMGGYYKIDDISNELRKLEIGKLILRGNDVLCKSLLGNWKSGK